MTHSASSTHAFFRRRRPLLLSGAVLLLAFLLLVLTSGSLLFRITAEAAMSQQDCRLVLSGAGVRPVGRFFYASWELSRNGEIVFQGKNLTGSYFFSLSKRFRLEIHGEALKSGGAFPGLFPDHHEKIPNIELHQFSYRGAGQGLSRNAIERNLKSELDLNIKSISLESSDLCRKIYANTGVHLDRYLKFESGSLQIRQYQDKLSLLSCHPLTGPYQILNLDGKTNLHTQAIDLKLIFGLQPELIRKLSHRHFFQYLIPRNWDGETPIFLPAPVILTGTLRHPRIDVGELFRAPAAPDQAASGKRPRVRLRLQRQSGSRKYQLQFPSDARKQEQDS